MGINVSVFNAINGLVGHSQALDSLMKFAASDLVFIVAAVVVVVWFWPGEHASRAKRQRVALSVAAATLIALGIGQIAGAMHYEARPFVRLTGVHMLIQHGADNGFPSDHATAAFAVAGGIFWWKRAFGIFMICMAVLVSFARVYVGVHFPDQVLAGAVIGLVIGSTALLIAPLWTLPQKMVSHMLPSWLVSAP